MKYESATVRLNKVQDGSGVESITTQWYLSTSKTTQTGGSWSDTPPTWTEDTYLWTRNKIVYNNPTSTAYTTPVCDSTWESVKALDDSLDQEGVFKRLTNGGTAQGIYIEDGKVYINASYIAAGIIQGVKIVGETGSIGGFTMTENTLSTTFRKDFTVYTQTEINAIRDKLVQVMAGNETWTEQELADYDMNMDGRVNSVDLLVMQKMLNGQESTYSEGTITIDSTSPAACIKIEVTGGYRAGKVLTLGFGGLSAYDAVVENKLTVDGNLVVDGDAMLDHVVFSDTDGYWYYRQWHSGVLECWLRKYYDTATPTGNTVNGLEEYSVTQSLPSEYVAFSDHRYVTNFNVITGSVGIASGYDAAQDSITFRFLDSSAQGWATVTAYLRGTWK